MPEPDMIDGDVYISPRYLAGPRAECDPGLQPLLDAGWHMTHDDDANIYLTRPDHKLRFGFIPEGGDDALWQVSGYSRPFASPHWAAAVSDQAPLELLTALSTALTTLDDAPTESILDYYTISRAYDAFAALAEAGWSLTRHHDRLEATSPDQLAHAIYDFRDLNHGRELTTNDTRWHFQAGPSRSWDSWYAVLSTRTPLHLITAVTTAIAGTRPAPRWNGEITHLARKHAQIAPVEPPTPVPTPLDVQRTAARRPTTLGTRSIPRWSTTTVPPAPTGPRPGPRR
jgi:hypothetical protein